ncbi:ABC transporter substrate-binding protein [Pseudodesulfovibrio sediminis]|uniref:ABC transporter substrate-binding protein n=1 Tax=Pseudodesulfovibrio sediminis TaxID=2810563 RepID=A0ABM7PAT2_9BACT|nr:ABC transporter substrate-binding protein [Pseudodesulfovibrio sediminis]BCS90205.1 ABC transporter substrate-binding protein [Pseudodesulfovibrio sediminis]
MTRFFLSLCFALLFCTTAFGQTVTDSTGKTITFNTPFKRIISLYAAHTENLFKLGLEREIIAVSKGEDYPANALEKPTLNARDGVEKLLAAKPDLVLIRPMLSRGYPGLWAALKKHGITVLSFQPNSIPEMYAYWRSLGRLTGREVQAEAMVEEFKSRIMQAEARLETVPMEDRPNVFFESVHRNISTFSPGSMPLFVLEMAGGINVATDARPKRGTNIASYGLERLLNKGKDIDVYLAQYGAMNQVSVKQIRTFPAASRIKATLSGNIFLVDEHLVSRPTMRLLLGIETVHRLLHLEAGN